jgi:hypothetical protein
MSGLGRPIHFLHIGKTGGSAIKAAFSQWSGGNILLHKHGHTLSDVPVGEKVFFFLRDPISRFVSGFYSRQRKGQPRFYSEHSALEARVFEAFRTPNELACALADENDSRHALAVRAFNGIGHLSHFATWYRSLDYFKSRLCDVLFIGFQDRLDADFVELKQLIDAPSYLQLPSDDIGAHRNPDNLDRDLDPVALHVLRNWYADDLNFVSYCRALRGLNSGNNWPIMPD